MRAKAGLWLRRALGVGLLLGAWQLASLHFPPLVVPPIPQVAATLVHLFQEPDFWPTVGTTLLRLAAGLAIGIGAGGVLGLIFGLCPKLEDVGTPMIHVLQSVPPVCWVVLALVWFGFNGLPCIFIVATATVPTVVINLSHGVRSVDRELLEIFERTYGAIKPRDLQPQKPPRRPKELKTTPLKEFQRPEEFLLVDGYNIIFAWEELKELAKINVESARDKLMDILSNYQGFRKNTVILVFDAYKVAGNKGEVMKYHNIYVVYTKEAETADQYIEKTVHEIGKRCKVTVATSDALEQLIIMGQGAERVSARGLYEEIALVNQELRSSYLNRQKKGNLRLFHDLPEDLAEYMEEVRIGKKEI